VLFMMVMMIEMTAMANKNWGWQTWLGVVGIEVYNNNNKNNNNSNNNNFIFIIPRWGNS
jgi:hypothetical protein